MILLNPSCFNVNEVNAGEYVFCKKGTQIFAEKKGSWTWIKANTLPSRWVGDYHLQAIADEFRKVDCCAENVIFLYLGYRIFNLKIEKYNSKKKTAIPLLKLLFPPSPGATKVERTLHQELLPSTPQGSQERMDQSSNAKRLEAMFTKPCQADVDRVNRSSVKQLQLLNDPRAKNEVYSLCSAPVGIEHYAEGASYFSYDAEGIEDNGWGCAWRAIQTCMSSLPQKARRSFLELYEYFGDEGHLRSIYHSRHVPHPLERDDEPFTSQNFTLGWATTFMGQMVFHSLGLDADLQVVNGIPTSEGPRMVFPNTSMTPKAFRARVKAHFEKKPALPVMIGNDISAFAIVGYGEDREDSTTFRLWIADPHTGRGVNRKESPDVGLYTIEYDNEGRGVRTSFSESMRRKMCDGGGSFDGIYLGFQLQRWAVLFPGEAER